MTLFCANVIINTGDKMNGFYIKKFIGTLRVSNKKGDITVKEKREYSSIIFTYNGKIKFSNSNNTLYSDEVTAIYLPRNCSYTNICLQDADSYMFSFVDSNENTDLINLHQLDEKTVSSYYSMIESYDWDTENFKILSILYSILDASSANSKGSPYIKKAKTYIADNFNKNITIEDIARSIQISRTYLSKLFRLELNTSIYQYILKIRMEKALMMIKENRQISEVALSVGYNDIFQFSRAYKKYYGKSPKHFR